MAIGAVGRYIKYFLESPKFMLEALLKQCLAMPIHNSQSESASQPPLHSTVVANSAKSTGKVTYSAVTTWWETIYNRCLHACTTMIQALLKQCLRTLIHNPLNHHHADRDAVTALGKPSFEQK
jgi:hypothetical protein